MRELYSPFSNWTYEDLLDSMIEDDEDEKPIQDENPVQDEVPVTLAELICPKG